MAHSLHFLAIDLGAESGRLIAGHLRGNQLMMEEIHRIRNNPVMVGDHLYWNILQLWEDIQAGLTIAANIYGEELVSLGVDTWGVDFGLLAGDGTLLGNPFHYRDARTTGMVEAASRLLSRQDFFAVTGVQPMQINSFYQLLSMVSSGVLAAAATFLNTPDLLNYWLCGIKASELTIASTTQCLRAGQPEWAEDVLQKFDIPARLFLPVVRPGSVLGALSPEVASRVGCRRIPVVNVGSHDTASAIAAIPARDRKYIFLSSGTWSLMGVELDDPILTPQALDYGFSNEAGVNKKKLFLKNITGLWLLQECKREWSASHPELTYDILTGSAQEAPALASLVILGDERFLSPGDMPRRIQAFCHDTGQPIPQSHGEITRCILQSLALEYRRTVDQLDALLGFACPVIHVIGGGSRNRLLNQFTADATQREVIAGPVEATALGNVIGQAIATGHLSSWDEGRSIVRESEKPTSYLPADAVAWADAYARYLRLWDAQ